MVYRLTIYIWNATINEWVKYSEDGTLWDMRMLAASYGVSGKDWEGLVRNGHESDGVNRYYLSVL